MTATQTAPRRLAADQPEFEEEPRRRLSILRVLVAVVVIGSAGYGVFLFGRDRIANLTSVPGTWFAPYVDATLTPNYQFQIPASNPARQTVLGFVVSQPGNACTPSWGAAYTLDEANQSLNLDSRVAQIRTEGGTPMVSFGGQKHTSLQVGCTNQSSLINAFSTVISRYKLTTIDLDVEGSAINDFGANRRLAAAMASLQGTDKNLAVWLTVPVETSGLQDSGQSLVTTMLRDHVSIAGVNAMAMDFTNSTPNLNMLGAAEQALTATHRQLGGLFAQYGIHLHSKVLWNRMGATVMIGQNNPGNQIFTLTDARGLKGFAKSTGLGRISLWSLNRDAQCGSSFPETGILSTTCSGVAQSNLEFSRIFGELPGVVAGRPVHNDSAFAVKPDTNPADSPYPLWIGTEPYVSGYKVVRNGFIYQAKWYNQGDDPATQVQFQYETPWLMVGPVLPGSHPPKLPTLASGTYPQWSLSQSYQAGTRVLFNGLPYQAKYDTQGASPAAEAADPPVSPWLPLFNIPGEPAQD